MPGVSVLRRRRGFPAALLGGGLGLLFNFNWACSLIVSSWRDPSGQVLGFTLGFVLLGLGWIERDLGVDRDCGGTGGVGGAGGRRSHFARCPHLRIEIGGSQNRDRGHPAGGGWKGNGCQVYTLCRVCTRCQVPCCSRFILRAGSLFPLWPLHATPDRVSLAASRVSKPVPDMRHHRPSTYAARPNARLRPTPVYPCLDRDKLAEGKDRTRLRPEIRHHGGYAEHPSRGHWRSPASKAPEPRHRSPQPGRILCGSGNWFRPHRPMPRSLRYREPDSWAARIPILLEVQPIERRF
jgi:hypothetical protein